MVDSEVQQIVGHFESAWNRGDATAFAENFLPDGTFTNVNGTTFEGHAAFEQRHREIFAGPAKGSSTVMTIRRSQRIRPDVAVVDVECNTTRPSGPPIRSMLLLVLTQDGGAWRIAAFHNTMVVGTPIVP